MATNKGIARNRKLLLLGSGGLSIGQAGEFDYSGTQAIKAIVEEGFEVLLVNPNIATVQTNPIPGVKVFLYPLTSLWVEKVIDQERPEFIVGSFGGQTALNCLIELEDQGILARYRVKNLGTSVNTLKMTEDRQKFAEQMLLLDIPIPPSVACSTTQEACLAATKISYPVIVRCAYALGGLGSGFADNEKELIDLVNQGLSCSPQVLVEKSLKGWKEVEYEVMRDRDDNSITICNMENFDPLGVHTGDSIVVTPSQSLTDDEYQKLRNASLKIVQELKIIGECNAQYALCPETSEYYIIEVNARLSRSSALASKASGYPIAYIAAKVILGSSLVALKNPVTGITSAFYEPALDYVTVKIPRWDLNKFKSVSKSLGSTMKSVGEVMGIGRNFPEALQKAVRMVNEDSTGLGKSLDFFDKDKETLEETLENPTDNRLFYILQALRLGYSVEFINKVSSVDKWFLSQLERIVVNENQIKDFSRKASVQKDIFSFLSSIPQDDLKSWKKVGFSDNQIINLLLEGRSDDFLKNQSRFELEKALRQTRKSRAITPVVKKIDTTSSEYPSPSNYLYLTYDGDFHDHLERDNKRSILILGGGAYRIGASVEFDWCAVACSEQIQASGFKSIIINCNPETVSTDYNSSSSLFFEELTVERILDIAEFEGTKEVVVSMGGQLPNKLAGSLHSYDFNLLGHSFSTIDMAEDRNKFSSLLDKIKIDQPRWAKISSPEALNHFIEEVGFPVLLRPSYVLSGAAMKVAYNKESLDRYLDFVTDLSKDYPVVVSQFISGARELDLDGIAKDGEVVFTIVSEHVENAGIHSGDATTVVPAQRLYVETVRKIKRAARQIARGLKLNGPFNIQFLAKDNQIKVIECNARAARSFPFVSKVCRINLAKASAEVFLGRLPLSLRHTEDELQYVGVKAAMFSFSRLKGADPVVGVEMASTGEVGCIAESFEGAMLLAMEASRVKLPEKGILISAGDEKSKIKFLDIIDDILAFHVPIYATKGTSLFLEERGVKTISLPWPGEGNGNVIDYIKNGGIDFVINIPKSSDLKELTRGSQIRKTSVEFGCSLITNVEKAVACIKSFSQKGPFRLNHKIKNLPGFLDNHHGNFYES
ncbi:MAG: carbamoyl phosphate synthase large subunit [Zetaproteobacteria bacterium]|nr:carbamoyl phosphate synthase large subunit [Pseudobdellovibrionaceae bacterium]